MTQFTQSTILTCGTTLNYYRTGGNKPPLVMIHGISDDAMCWQAVAEPLADRFDCVMVDLRGHGKSEAPEEGYRLEILAREVEGLINGLGLRSPVILGHSLGAATTLVLAALFPSLPRAIMLEDPPAFWLQLPDDDKAHQHRANMANSFKAQKRQTYQELVDEAHVTRKSWSEMDIHNWANAKHRFSPRIELLLSEVRIQDFDLPKAVSKVTCPVLFIQGVTSLGALATDADVASLRQLLPHLKAAKIEKAGHSVRRYNYTDYMSAVNKFLYELS